MSGRGLNPDQEAAASALDGSVLIAAGAGSGKTRTLAERFVRAVCAEGEAHDSIPVDRILTITYTEKAAGELAERIRSTLRGRSRNRAAGDTESAWISTIHGFCARILRRFALEAGLDPLFGIADPVQSGQLSEQAFEAACGEVLTSPEGRMLLGDFEYDAVLGAVTRLARDLKARGLGSDALHAPATREAGEILGDAISVFANAPAELAACGGSVLAVKLSQRCESIVGDLSALDATHIGDEELAHHCWKVLAAWTPGGKSAAVAEVREALIEEHARLLGQAAATASRRHAHAMIELTGRHIARYDALKSKLGLLDFDDLQVRTLELLERSPDVQAACQDMFGLVMIDEFQDTDALQAGIVNRVAGDRLCTVGDECQSIYGFRGADIDVYRTHNASMQTGGARSFSLRYNYRSHPDILAFVNTLFGSDALLGNALIPLRHGREEPSPPLLPEGESRVEIVVVGKDGADSDSARKAEADAVADRLAALRDRYGVTGGDIAVLLRSYTHADVYAEALRRRGFAATVVGGSRFFELREVVTLRALVNTLANVRDENALMTLLASDVGRISDDGLWTLSVRARSHHEGLWGSLNAPPAGLSPEDVRRVFRISGMLSAAREAIGHVPLEELVLRAVEECDYDLMLLAGGESGRHAYANVLKFARMAAAYEGSGGAGPVGFAAYVDAKERFREHTPPASLPDDRTGAVRVMSVHAAKGLEFPVVAAVGLGTSGRAPNDIVRSAPDSAGMLITTRIADRATAGVNRPPEFARLDAEAKSRDNEEAKRVFYVACTRAQDMLILSGTTALDKDPADAPEVPMTWLRRAVPALDREVGSGPVVELGGVEVGLTLASQFTTEDIEPEGETRAEDPHEPEPEPHDSAFVSTERSSTSAPRTLSYSDLSLYDRCPRRFWAERLLRVGTFTPPAEEGSLAFGTAVHAALEAVADGVRLGASRLHAIRRFHGVPEEMTAEFLSAVAACTDTIAARRLDSMPVVRREWGFGVRVDGDGDRVDLVGSIDAYGRDGTAGLVVDYKTGDSGEERDLRERYALQARCYALAVLADGVEEVTVEFLRSQCLTAEGEPQTVTFTFSAEDAPAIHAEIRARHDGMVTGAFEALADRDSRVCHGCAISESLCTAP